MTKMLNFDEINPSLIYLNFIQYPEIYADTQESFTTLGAYQFGIFINTLEKREKHSSLLSALFVNY